MVQFIRNNLIPLSGAIILLLAGYFYYSYSGGSSTATLTASESAVISKDLLSSLSNLRTIRLDNSIFSDASFKSLTDFGVVIPQQAVGRPNPFLPLRSAVPR